MLDPDELRNVSVLTGASEATLRQLAVRGVSMRDAELGLCRLQLASPETFGYVGITKDDVMGMRPDELLSLVADRLSRVENTQERFALASRIFGRATPAMMTAFDDWFRSSVGPLT